MSRPSQEQIDEMVAESRRELTSGQLFLARAPVIVALADDLKAARDELDRLRLADFDGLNKQRAELIEELSRAKDENDAMAALLEGFIYGHMQWCGYQDGCRWGETCWDCRRRALLAARAKRMGETGCFDGSLNCACGRKPSALHVHGGPAEELDAAARLAGRWWRALKAAGR